MASIEFAFIATALLLLLGGAFDLCYMTAARRDAERVAVEVVQTLSACTTSPCILKAGGVLTADQKNAFLTSVTPTIGWAYVSRVDAKILVSFGNMTYLPPDVEAAAKLALTGNYDNGVCSLVTAKIDSLSILSSLFTKAQSEPRYFMCTIQSKNSKVV